MPSIAEKSTGRVATAANIALALVIVMTLLAIGALSNWFRLSLNTCGVRIRANSLV